MAVEQMRRKVIIGVDLGATKILSGMGTPQGQILQKTKTWTPTGGPEAVLDVIAESIAALIKTAETRKYSIKGIAAAVPGPLTYPQAVMKDSPNLGWQRVEFKKEMSDRLGRSVIVDKDTNLAAWGEYYYGQGMKYENLLYLTVSTGIGGGIIADGRLYHGHRGGAGEFGHMVIDPAGPACRCGRRGCMEALASGTAIAARLQGLATAGQGKQIAALKQGLPPGAAELGQAARQGDPEAMMIIAELNRNLAIGIANLINIFNPQILVMGGGVMIGLQDLLLEPIRALVREQVFPLHRQGLQIEVTRLGDDIGLYGCMAAIARDI